MPCWGILLDMKLLAYLKDRDETVYNFAVRIGEPDNTIRKIVYGQRQPSLPLAIKISAATDGEVSPNELLLPEAPTQERSAAA